MRAGVWLCVALAAVGACTGTPSERTVAGLSGVTSASPAALAPDPATSVPSSQPGFAASIAPIDEAMRLRMGTSWREGCPVGLGDLRVLRLRHWGFDGAVREGELIVHRRWAAAVIGVFRALFEARFPIERMEPSNGYAGDEGPLAQRNNTAGFSCRAPVGGARIWSEHSYGRAIDVNPGQNPYVYRSRVEPSYAGPYVDRARDEPGMIRPNDVVVRAFRAIGWRWGGLYSRNKDYMHFSATGR